MLDVIEYGRVRAAAYRPSPNCDDRPSGTCVDLLVVHGISLPPGEFGGPYITALFRNRLNPEAHPYFRDVASLRVSSHLLILRDGVAIQFVPFDRRAWHAGASEFQGRSRCNDFAVGIELEGTDEIPYSNAQYHRLVSVTQALMRAYPGIVPARIVGHSDVAPDRKTDPGPAFDWLRLRRGLAATA